MAETRVCPGCGEAKLTTDFWKLLQGKDGLQWSCKTCMAASKKMTRVQRNERNRAIAKAAKDVPCMDCGLRFPSYVMDFDHVSGKKFNIGRALSKDISAASLQAEIAKCDVVCANCHRVRTHERKELKHAV